MGDRSARSLTIICLTLCIAICNAQAPTCVPQTKCVPVGSSCNSSANCGTLNYPPCLQCNNSICYDGVCLAWAAKGSKCGNSSPGPLCDGSDRYYPLASTCISGICGVSGDVFGPGDSCSFDDPLIQDANTTGGCYFGNCTTSGHCPALLNGDDCTSNHMPCVQGSYCDIRKGVCSPWATAGSFCAPELIECAPNTFCTDEQCVEIFSVTNGTNSSCFVTDTVGNSGSFASILCAAGLACLNDQCIDPDDSRTGKSCTTNASCTDGTYPDSFECVNDPCTKASTCQPQYTRSNITLAAAYKGYYDCLTLHKCDGGQNPWKSANSNCAQIFCFPEWVTWQNALNAPIGEC